MRKPCIFCSGLDKKSKEHLWSQWMHDYLNLDKSSQNTREENTYLWKDQIGNKKLERQGNLATTKFRVVCETCNNGWMSVLENEVKPIFIRIFKNEGVILKREEQDLLARWIAMKAITGEHAGDDIHVTPEPDRNSLMLDKKIPESFAIYIGNHESESDTAWLRISQTIALDPNGPNPPLGNINRNTQTISFICGPLFVFVFVFSIREKGIIPTEFFNLGGMKQIFPPRDNIIMLDQSSALSVKQMSNIANALDSMKNVKHISELQESE
ncbi:MAG: hypothetical protein ACC657_17545 [Thiohalomonadales bacterium]